MVRRSAKCTAHSFILWPTLLRPIVSTTRSVQFWSRLRLNSAGHCCLNERETTSVTRRLIPQQQRQTRPILSLCLFWAPVCLEDRVFSSLPPPKSHIITIQRTFRRGYFGRSPAEEIWRWVGQFLVYCTPHYTEV